MRYNPGCSCFNLITTRVCIVLLCYVLSVQQLYINLSFIYLKSIIINFLRFFKFLIGGLLYLTQLKNTLGQHTNKIFPAESIFLWNITDNVFHVVGMKKIGYGMKGLHNLDHMNHVYIVCIFVWVEVCKIW